MSPSFVLFLFTCRPSLKLLAKPFSLHSRESHSNRKQQTSEKKYRRFETGQMIKPSLSALVENIVTVLHWRSSCLDLGLFTRGSFCPWIFTSEINRTASWQKRKEEMQKEGKKSKSGGETSPRKRKKRASTPPPHCKTVALSDDTFERASFFTDYACCVASSQMFT